MKDDLIPLIETTKILYKDIDDCISKLCKYRLDGDKRKAERQECRMECLMVRTLQQLDCIINEIEEL